LKLFFKRKITFLLSVALLFNLWGIVTVQADELTDQSYEENIGIDLDELPVVTITTKEELEANLFHGSISKYNYMGGQAASLNSGDVVTINLGAVGTAAHKPMGSFSISCKVD
jgi:hypothetical protein